MDSDQLEHFNGWGRWGRWGRRGNPWWRRRWWNDWWDTTPIVITQPAQQVQQSAPAPEPADLTPVWMTMGFGMMLLLIVVVAMMIIMKKNREV